MHSSNTRSKYLGLVTYKIYSNFLKMFAILEFEQVKLEANKLWYMTILSNYVYLRA